MIALSDARQARGRAVSLKAHGHVVDAMHFEFGDLQFTSDSKPANALSDLSVTIHPMPPGDNSYVARLEYYLQPAGFRSLHPFELRFGCARNKNARQVHFSFGFGQSLGSRAERRRFETPFPSQHYQHTEMLVLGSAVQMCARTTGGSDAGVREK
jgi:hypothetical protein